LEAAVRRDEYKDREGALEWCNKGLALFPHNFHLLNMSGVLCLDQQNYSRAREIFLQLLSQETKPGGKRYIILNNLAYANALIGDPELLPEADTYSKEAYSAAPWIPSITGTRGTVLVAMGQIEVGIKLLKESYEKAWSPRSKAENACHLAIANARNGNRDQADKYLKLAQQLDSQCRLIERVQEEFQKTSH
jgi:tetratricopeptide (TPR) repeat protein